MYIYESVTKIKENIGYCGTCREQDLCYSPAAHVEKLVLSGLN